MVYRGRDWLERLLVVFGLATALLGIIILVGWYQNLPLVTTLFLGLTPMAPRTAIGFCCLGFGLSLFAWSRRTMAVLAWLGVHGGLYLSR